MCVPSNKTYQTYQTKLSFCRLGHTLRYVLGGAGGKKLECEDLRWLSIESIENITNVNKWYWVDINGLCLDVPILWLYSMLVKFPGEIHLSVCFPTAATRFIQYETLAELYNLDITEPSTKERTYNI